MEKRIKLDNMLWELIDIEHKITQLEEAGSQWGLRKLKDKRASQMEKILNEALE